MSDELLYKLAETDDIEEKPFLEKSLVFIMDQNPTSYSTNEIIFETGTLSSNGRYNDYRDAFISIPLVITASGIDFTAASNKDTDFLLALKNAHLNLIQSLTIDVNNTNAIQNCSYVNMLLNYKLHSEMSNDDVDLNGPTIGYGKDGNGWRYESAASASGRGLCNNLNNNVMKQMPSGQQYGDLCNEGMWKRQQNFMRVTPTADNGRSLVLSSNTVLKNQGINYVDAGAYSGTNYKVWYIDAIIRLKDLLFFNKMPALTKGAFIRIKMTVNQCSFQVSKSAGGMLDYVANSMSIGPNGINPLMFAASNVPYQSNFGVASATDTTSNASFIEGGSSCIPVSTTISCAVNVCRNSTLNLLHPKQTCRLYIPAYVLHPSYEASYIEKPIRRFKYTDVTQFTVSNCTSGSAFNAQITQGLKHIQRLIICPIMNASAHGSETTAFSALYSPFNTDGCGTCSPYVLSNFQVQIGGKNVFNNPINYNYELYLSELQNYGVNSNLTTGMTSGRISLHDWNNNYGFIVVDLSRRYNVDDDASLSVQISGTFTSLKAMDLYCFLEYQKEGQIDVTNGQFQIVGPNSGV